MNDLFDAALAAITFYRFFCRKLYWKRCWSWRADVKWRYLLQSEINLNCVWPNAVPIRIPCNTKTNTKIQVENIVMVWPKHTNHSVKDVPVKCRHRNRHRICKILIRSLVNQHTFASWIMITLCDEPMSNGRCIWGRMMIGVKPFS